MAAGRAPGGWLIGAGDTEPDRLALGNGGGFCRGGPDSSLFGTTVAAGAFVDSSATTVGTGGGAMVGVSAKRGGADNCEAGGSDPERAALTLCDGPAWLADSSVGRTVSDNFVSSRPVEPGATVGSWEDPSGGTTSAVPFKAAIASGTDGKILNSKLK